MAKRKRDDSQSRQTREVSSTTTDDSEDTKVITVAENPFKVKVFPYSEAQKAQRAQNQWTGLYMQKPVVSGGAKCTYKIRPAGKWNEMKKYTKFVVSEKSFGIGDYIYIYHGNQLHDAGLSPEIDPSNWVAQVLEIRALDSAHVYLRVFWMYWPDELPGGREKHHGAHELVASNHMEIMDAMTVTDTADVQLLNEDGPRPTKDLYWRQTLDILTNRISRLRRDCYCDNYHNPEKLLIQCPHCDKNLHEACLLRDACSRAWSQEQNRKTTSGPGQQLEREISSSPQAPRFMIPDSQRSNGSNGLNGTHGTLPQSQIPPPPSPPPPRDSIQSRGRKRKAYSNPLIDPWEDQMKAHLGMKLVDGEETTEATGMATVCYDPVDQESQNIQIGLRCLMPKCGKWLYDEPVSQQEIVLEDIRPKRDNKLYKTTVETDNEDI